MSNVEQRVTEDHHVGQDHLGLVVETLRNDHTELPEALARRASHHHTRPELRSFFDSKVPRMFWEEHRTGLLRIRDLDHVDVICNFQTSAIRAVGASLLRRGCSGKSAAS